MTCTGCSTACDNDCAHSCNSGCTGCSGCSGCSNSCDNDCASNCSGGCSGCSGCSSCSDTCGVNGCTSCSGCSSCTTSCGSNGCSTACTIGCNSNCTGTCNTGCNTACLGCDGTCNNQCNNACTDTSKSDVIANLGSNITTKKKFLPGDATNLRDSLHNEYTRRGLTPPQDTYTNQPAQGEYIFAEHYSKIFSGIDTAFKNGMKPDGVTTNPYKIVQKGDILKLDDLDDVTAYIQGLMTQVIGIYN